MTTPKSIEQFGFAVPFEGQGSKARKHSNGWRSLKCPRKNCPATFDLQKTRGLLHFWGIAKAWNYSRGCWHLTYPWKHSVETQSLGRFAEDPCLHPRPGGMRKSKPEKKKQQNNHPPWNNNYLADSPKTQKIQKKTISKATYGHARHKESCTCSFWSSMGQASAHKLVIPFDHKDPNISACNYIVWASRW